MKLIVFGATGATGRLLVTQALEEHHDASAPIQVLYRFAFYGPPL